MKLEPEITTLKEALELQTTGVKVRCYNDFYLHEGNPIEVVTELITKTDPEYRCELSSDPINARFQKQKGYLSCFNFSVQPYTKENTSNKKNQYFMWLDFDIEKYLKGKGVDINEKQFQLLFNKLKEDPRIHMLFKSHSWGIKLILAFNHNLINHDIYC